MSSEVALEVAPRWVTPTSGKGALGTGWFRCLIRIQALIWNHAGWGRGEGAGKRCERGVYVHQRLSFHSHGKARIQQDGRQSRGQNRTREIRPSGIVGGL